MSHIEGYARVFAWMQDFWAAFDERPLLLRWIARLAMGKYAYRELHGSREAIIDNGYGIHDYSLHDMDYHKDRISWDSKTTTENTLSDDGRNGAF